MVTSKCNILSLPAPTHSLSTKLHIVHYICSVTDNSISGNGRKKNHYRKSFSITECICSWSFSGIKKHSKINNYIRNRIYPDLDIILRSYVGFVINLISINLIKILICFNASDIKSC